MRRCDAVVACVSKRDLSAAADGLIFWFIEYLTPNTTRWKEDYQVDYAFVNLFWIYSKKWLHMETKRMEIHNLIKNFENLFHRNTFFSNRKQHTHANTLYVWEVYATFHALVFVFNFVRVQTNRLYFFINQSLRRVIILCWASNVCHHSHGCHYIFGANLLHFKHTTAHTQSL